MNTNKRYQIRVTRWVTEAEFDDLDDAQAYLMDHEEEDMEFEGQMGELVDTRPDKPAEVVVDSWS